MERSGEGVCEVSRFNASLWALVTRSFCNHELDIVSFGFLEL